MTSLLLGAGASIVHARLEHRKQITQWKYETVYSLDGTPHILGGLLHQPPGVILFVSPECGFCKGELGAIDQLNAAPSQGLTEIVVADAKGRSESELIAFRQEHPFEQIYFDRSGARQRLSLAHVPAILEIDRSGAVFGAVTGARTLESLQSILAEVRNR